jgi:hypothetical protein
MKKINWLKVIAEVLKIIAAGLAGAGTAASAATLM